MHERDMYKRIRIIRTGRASFCTYLTLQFYPIHTSMPSNSPRLCIRSPRSECPSKHARPRRHVSSCHPALRFLQPFPSPPPTAPLFPPLTLPHSYHWALTIFPSTRHPLLSPFFSPLFPCTPHSTPSPDATTPDPNPPPPPTPSPGNTKNTPSPAPPQTCYSCSSSSEKLPPPLASKRFCGICRLCRGARAGIAFLGLGTR